MIKLTKYAPFLVFLLAIGLNSCSENEELSEKENTNLNLAKNSEFYSMSSGDYQISHLEGNRYLTSFKNEKVEIDYIFTDLNYSTEVIIDDNNMQSLIISNESDVKDKLKISNMRKLENGSFLYDFSVFDGTNNLTHDFFDIGANHDVFVLNETQAKSVPWGPIGIGVSIAIWLLSGDDDGVSADTNCRMAAVEGCGEGNVQNYKMVVDEGWFTSDSHCEFSCK
ncbi:MAG: hypothetical protein ABF274_13385 [Nonlabens sp.]|uniref:hypothetical protein n=1 Tax=Nonlabens sp. TaxID=1888209 RepID=UPI003219E0B6